MAGRELHAGVFAEFRTAEEMLEAVARLRESGYHQLETYSPYAVPGAEERLGLPRSRLPWLIFAGGIVGALLAYGIQWYANARDYPQNAGGRPPHAVPAFIFIAFEGTVLLAALTAFFGVLAALRLPRPWHPVFEIEGFERASIDRFWVGIDAADPRFDPVDSARRLEALGALRVFLVEGEG